MAPHRERPFGVVTSRMVVKAQLRMNVYPLMLHGNQSCLVTLVLMLGHSWHRCDEVGIVYPL